MIECKLRDKRRADNPVSPIVCVFLMFDRLEDVISKRTGGVGGVGWGERKARGSEGGRAREQFRGKGTFKNIMHKYYLNT